MEPRFVDSYGYRTKLVIPEVFWNIYGHPSNFNHFVTTALVAADDGERELRISNKKTHQRRRYVGDSAPITVQGHTYDYMYDPGRKTGTAIPGWSFILDDGTERRQFTTTGDVTALLLYLADEVKNDTKLYTQGSVYYIEKPTSE